jgi:hypothetical protein
VTPSDVLKRARAEGLQVDVDGDDLTLYAPNEPPEDLLDLLKQHKPQLIRFLRPSCDGWTGEDWTAFFDERAAIGEYDGALTRPEAEARAFECCVAKWLDRHPLRSPPGRCAHCGEANHGHDPLVPFGADANGAVWLHVRCWQAWYDAQRSRAGAELHALGVHRPGVEK